MTHCRICTGPALAIGPDDHEVVCGNCIDEAVLDAYLTDLPNEPLAREQVTRAFFLSRRADATPRAGIDAIVDGDDEFPLPDDLLIDELIELLADEETEIQIERIDAPDEQPVLRPSAEWLASQHPALRGELHRPPAFNLPIEPTTDSEGSFVLDDTVIPGEFPGYRHFRVLESSEVDGKRSWTIRDVYRKG
jgi:hypothetical protein